MKNFDLPLLRHSFFVLIDHQTTFRSVLWIPLLLLFMLAISCKKDSMDDPTGSQFSNAGVYDIQIKVDTLNRWFKLIVPSNYSGDVSHPLLLAYHGGGLSMGFMYKNRKDLINRCEIENWLLVFPNGANFEDNRGAAEWNAIHCCAEVGLKRIDDVGFTRRIIDTLTTELNVDRSRVYALGGSNGAMFVHKLGVEAADIFAALGENSGTAGGKRKELGDSLLVAHPTQPIPFIMLHGINDQQVKFNGGWSQEGNRYDLSFQESVSIWVNNSKCNPTPDTTIVQGGKGRVWIRDYKDCAGNADIRAITLENVGHGWFGIQNSGFDGTNATIDFFKAHHK